ncbi:MAG: lactate racemase domain-containing protein [Dehalococcoidales bacterium]|nr:lactate racemase domain-containing protein [Dehalococcoidales bacterium]
MSLVRVPQLNWYGTKEFKLSLPDRWQVEVGSIAGYNQPAMKPADISAVLNSPIGTRPLNELARGKKEVVILFDDMSRITRSAEIVPHVLKALAEAGIKDKNIRFVCALGCHGTLTRIDFAKKLGEDILARFPVYNHNPFDNCVPIGKTKTYGTEVSVNMEVMKCDLKIAIGMVVPHPMSGFGGGGKIILPGVSSFATIQHNHHNTFRDMSQLKGKMGVGIFDENPMRFDIAEAAELAGLDFIVNCLINEWGETVKLFAGALKPAYAEAVSKAKLHYLTPKLTDKDIAISNGFIKANESNMGLTIAYQTVSRKDGGDVVVMANAQEGMVTHYLLGPWGKFINGPERQMPRIPANVKRVIIYSEYPDLAGRGWFPNTENVVFLQKWDEVLRVLEADYPSSAKVAVFPNAEILYTK